jgi:hypothetical protein
VPHDDYGAALVTWTEIQAWSELMHIALERWEMQAIAWIGRIGQNVAAKSFTESMKRPSTNG